MHLIFKLKVGLAEGDYISNNVIKQPGKKAHSSSEEMLRRLSKHESVQPG